MASIGETRRRWTSEARRLGTDPRDVDVFLCDLTHRSFASLLAREEEELDSSIDSRLAELMRRRLDREPLQYIRGRSEFLRREFAVDSRALIPRPETELLVVEAVKRIRKGNRVLDIGTGSGCIAISIALERPELHLFASDRSIEALALARHNAARLGARIHFFSSDVADAATGPFDAIVSNPPYVPAGDLEGLQPEVRDFEPHLALSPGSDGKEIVERILADATRILTPDGLILLEIGFSQSVAVGELVLSYGRNADFVDDLAGIPRIAIITPRALNP
ncbi:MAG TPA: peptide chain release factor N(5)-glutamine methyltransferase [Thermoanaerobaculia bacterium]|nr:peptide chain release factor N(5)-glutamine methyltransferase [Thermoanaerobaculia bacterium]